MAKLPYENIVVRSWDEFTQLVTDRRFRSWAFRGQANADWQMFSSLSRYLTKFNILKDFWPGQEERILRIFRRKAHLMLAHIPDDSDSFQWLGLMQHHGAPTRLLDFTWSPYVAAFFALESATENAAVWALFPPALFEAMTAISSEEDIGPRTPGNYEKYFLNNSLDLVALADPYRMNQRLIAQSGTFVMPGVLDKPIEEVAPKSAIVKITFITRELRNLAMKELYNMNIKQDTLFPGLDGLARAMAYELEYHWAFDPVTRELYEGYWKTGGSENESRS